MANQNITFDVEYDLVVVGSGGSGKIAALTAAQGGLNVALLEKMPETGGTSVFTEGMAAFESSEQKERKMTKDRRPYPMREQAFRCYIDSSSHQANPDVIRMMVDNSAEMIDFLKSLGVVYYDVAGYAKYDEDKELPVFHYPEGMGARVQEILLRHCQNSGMDIFTSTPAKKLFTQDGAVVGVQALDADGNIMNIGAKAVILATGGYGNSPEMLKKYFAYPRSCDRIEQFTGNQNTGDGLNMAIEVGADTFGLGNVGCIPLARGKTLESGINAIGSQPGLWINKFGRRFFSEEYAMTFVIASFNIAKQNDGTAYSIFDVDVVKRMIEEGSDVSLGMFVEYKKKLPGLQAQLDQSVADGTTWKGETIEELAKAIGVDPTVLAETVADYNDACDKGFDPQFYKPAEYLRPVRKGPFYAVDMAAGVLTTTSSVRVNGNLQATDEFYRPIPGLYCVGQEASGLYGSSYNLGIPGSANGFAHTSGRTAARHVVKTLNVADV